jgi:DnaJ-class molecular chaperone
VICPTCHGKGVTEEFVEDELGAVMIVLPCPDCLGGVMNCCEGLRAEPEPSQNVFPSSVCHSGSS